MACNCSETHEEGRISEATAFCGGRPPNSRPLGDRTPPDAGAMRDNAQATALSLVAATPRWERCKLAVAGDLCQSAKFVALPPS